MPPRAWHAHWIGPANDPRQELGAFVFRCRLDLREVPDRLPARISADQRYKLVVNGRPAGRGPQRGEERHWHFETLDLAPHLQAGENEVLALVWNFGRFAPMAQHTVRTAFILEVDDPDFALNTPGNWQVAPLPHWDFAMMHSHDPNYYIDIGPGEIFDATKMEIVQTRATPAGRQDTEIGTTVRRLVERMAAVSGARAIAILLEEPAIGLLRGIPPGIGLEAETIRGLSLESKGSLSAPRLLGETEAARLGFEDGAGVLLPLAADDESLGAMLVVASPGSHFEESTIVALAGMSTRLGNVLASLQRYGEHVWGRDDLRSILEDLMSTPGKQALRGGKSEVRLAFRPPHPICPAEERGAGFGGTPWMLVASSLPPQRYEPRNDLPTMRSTDDDSSREPALFPRMLEAGQPLLLDYGELVCAYPRFVVGVEPGPSRRRRGPATVTVTYAESLWNTDGTKGDRDQVAGKTMAGYQDKIVFDRDSVVFEPFWWRTYRYLQIETDTRCVLESVDAIETGYPMEVESTFEADDPIVAPLWDVSVRTARRCAGETYFDCPYWEQLQYVGDSRIQALIGYYLGRDRRLQREAVATIGRSLLENGLTQSRYPSRQAQVIPPFSLWWIAMLYDQWLYDPDAPPADHAVVRRVIEAFRRIGSQEEEFWMFADWVPGWKAGVPPGGSSSPVHRLTLALVEAMAARMTGDPIGDPPSVETAGSEHAEALARLVRAQHGTEPGPWPDEFGPEVARCTYYFSYYKHLAMFASNDHGRDYLEELGPWKEMIESGLTTFAENPEPTRSDCHAWSAHPILGYFQIVAGVGSAAPGWRRARIRPNPGRLRRFLARVAHPAGDLVVGFEGGRLEVESPVPFDLDWMGRTGSYEPGSHRF